MEIFNYIEAKKRFLKFDMSLQDAEDLTQDICEMVWRRREWFEGRDLEDQKNIINRCIRNKRIDVKRSEEVKIRVMAEQPIKYQKPQIYSMLELKEVAKKIDDNNLDFILDRALGYSDQELKDKYGKNIIVRIFNGRNFLNGLTSHPGQRYCKKKGERVIAPYNYIKKALRVAVILFVLISCNTSPQREIASLLPASGEKDSTLQTYTIAPISGAVSYIWTLPDSWVGHSKTNSITVSVGSRSGYISVAGVNNCGQVGKARLLPVTVIGGIPMCPLPKPINCSLRIRSLDIIVDRWAGGLVSNFLYKWKKNGVYQSWTGQTVAKANYILGDTLTVIVYSQKLQTPTDCWIPGVTSKIIK